MARWCDGAMAQVQRGGDGWTLKERLVAGRGWWVGSENSESSDGVRAVRTTRTCVIHVPNAPLDIPAVRNRPADPGDTTWQLTQPAPELSPMSSTRPGSPPNAAMLSRTHFSASRWSCITPVPWRWAAAVGGQRWEEGKEMGEKGIEAR